VPVPRVAVVAFLLIWSGSRFRKTIGFTEVELGVDEARFGGLRFGQTELLGVGLEHFVGNLTRFLIIVLRNLPEFFEAGTGSGFVEVGSVLA
jgi:hypothetical protein